MRYGGGTRKKGRRIRPAPKTERRPGGPAGPYPEESSNPKVRARARKERAAAEAAGETPIVPVPTTGASGKRAARYEKEDRARTLRKARRIRRERTATKRLKRLERKAIETLRDKPEPIRETAPKLPPRPTIKPASRSGEGSSRSEQLEAAIDLQVIEPAKKARVLPKEKTTGQKAAQVVAETGIALAPVPGLGLAGKAATRALKTGSTTTKAIKATPRLAKPAQRAKGAVERAATRERGRQANNLARHRSQQAARRASRRLRPTARSRYKLKARRKGRDLRVRHGREGRKVARRNRSVKVGLLSPYLTGTATGVGGLGAAGIAASGHVRAFRDNPAGVTARTLEIGPGLVISTADLAVQAAQAIGTGNSAGLRKRIAEDTNFAIELTRVMASGDEERVKRYVEENGLIVPLMLAPGVARLGRRPIKRTAGELVGERGRRAARRHKTRKRSARDAAREEAEAMAEVKAAGEPVVNAYLGGVRRRGVKGRRKLRKREVDRGDLVALAAEEGLTPASAVRAFPAVADKWDRRPRFTDKKEGGVTGHELVDLVRSDPGVWQDRAFWRAVDAYRAQEPAVRTSEGVVDIEQAKTYGVQFAEDRPPPAARPLVPNALSRADVAVFIGKGGEGGKRVRRLRETITAAEGRARGMRGELRQLEKAERLRQRRAGTYQTGTRKGQPRLSPLTVMNRRREQLLDVEADIRGMRAELAGTQRRHRTIAESLRDPAQEATAKAEFDAELEAVRADKGLERGVYVPHTDVGREGIPVAQPITRAGKKIHRRERGPESLAERGRVDYSLSSIVEAGIQAPRIRQHVHNYVNRQVQEGAVPVAVRTADGRVESRRLVTREEAERGLRPEQKQQVVLFPLNQWKQAVTDENVERMTTLVDDLAREVDWRADDKGHKYVVLDRDLAAEIKVQVSAPGVGLRGLQIGSRGLARAILASPAWAIAQVFAEGLQGALAINPLNPGNVYHMVQGYRGLRQMDPDARRDLRADAGAMPGMGSTPREWFAADGRTHKGLASNFRKAERVLPIKRLLQALKLDWLKAIDRAKGGEIRVAVAVAKAHKDAMGFGKQIERTMRGERAMSEKLAKMTPGQRLEWSIRSTPAKRQLENYLDDVLGNWRALSRKERVAAPALIFYPFLRMSLQWPFYAFPKRHPIRAAVMYDLAAAHNAQVRELLGGPPPWFGDYATAIVYGNQPDEATLTRATRIVPGANAIFEAVSGGFDVAAQRAFNPVVGYFNALVNGIDPLSGEKVDPDYLSQEERSIARVGLVASLMFNTPPPLRALDQLRGPKESTAFPIVGPRREKDALGELLEELNGTPTERAVQTLFNPLPTKDGDEAQDMAVMGRIFEIWRTSGSDAQDAVINNDSLGEREKQKRLKQMRARTEEADSELHRLYDKHDIGFEAEEKAEMERYYSLKYPDEDEGTGNKYLDAGSASEGNKYLEGAGASKGNKYLGGG